MYVCMRTYTWTCVHTHSYKDYGEREYTGQMVLPFFVHSHSTFVDMAVVR